MALADHAPRRGFSIQIFLVEGSPSGLRLVEKTNWTGLGVVCPRPRFNLAKTEKEFGRAGVYVLLGPSESSDVPIAYIGEADPVRSRLERHHAETDFWTTAYFFTSKDANLNKAHVEHLEHRLIGLAKDAKRCQLTNLNMPGKPSLSDADHASIETFLDEMLLCFPVLGVSIFEKPEHNTKARTLFTFMRRDLTAKGYESEDGFIVLKDSDAASSIFESMQSYAQGLRHELIKSGVLLTAGHELKFTQDFEFTSPSTAASVVAGASVNGRDYWRTADGKTLKELQERAEE
ncbi:MAG TPA: GIY-YIG nuclease family protein [Chthoniobacterales bacterium]|jgi:hypothetical protein|nr:GIY-YIG nuclease family protein [Chthoniobacterales bacterium]